MKRGLCLVGMCALLSPVSLFAHPHVYVDLILQFVTDETGIVGIDEEWTLRANYSARLIQRFDVDHDGTLSSEEQHSLYDAAFSNLATWGFFTHVILDGDEFASYGEERFTAAITNSCLVYRFFLPLHIPARGQSAEIIVYDETNYVSFALRNLIDPPSTEGAEYWTHIRVDMDMFCAAQPPGQRRIEVRLPDLSSRSAFPLSPVLVALDPYAELPEVSADDPFLKDQGLFNGYSSDNPFMSFGATP